MEFTGEGQLYGVCSRAGVVSVGGWLKASSTEWTTVARGLPPAAVGTFISVASEPAGNAVKARVTTSGHLDLRLMSGSPSPCLGDVNIAYVSA